MFVFLSKLLPLFAYPLGLCSILLVLAVILNKHKRLRNGLTIVAVVILWGFSNHWVALVLTHSLEWQYLPAQVVPQAEAIVVLGGGTSPAQYPRPTTEINGAGNRVLYAAHLYREGKAPFLLLSGGTIDWMGSTSTTPAAEMADILTFMGVPQGVLWLEDKSQNTHENAVFSAQILKEKGIHRILLVTSAIHMPRAMAVFKKQGLEIIPAPTDFKVTQVDWDSLVKGSLESHIIYLLPDASDLGATTDALKEYIGLFVYRLMGWG